MDIAVIYADREHFSNFSYFTGFDPRFEESILIIHHADPCYLLLGNECFSLHKLSKIPAIPLLCQQLSLPNQPADSSLSLPDILVKAGITPASRIGVIGWKLFPGKDAYYKPFSAPAFLISALSEIAGHDALIDATDLLISPEYGLRMTNSAEEIAYYEFGASYASACVQNAFQYNPVGMTEIEYAILIHKTGSLPMSTHPMLSAGRNVFKGLISPGTYQIQRGDPITQSVGCRGGLSVRNGYIDGDTPQPTPAALNFVEQAALPYFKAVTAWIENLKIGVTGGEMYDLVDTVIPKKQYGWVLNPSHMTADEEWMCSPFSPGSKVALSSGMLIQMDIIPSIDGYVSPNCEDGFCIADEHLRKELSEKYPKVWKRMNLRRNYMIQEIGIQVPEELLPMSNIAGYYPPYYLNPTLAFRIKH